MDMPIWFRRRPRPTTLSPAPVVSLPLLTPIATLRTENRNEYFGVLFFRSAGMMSEMECVPLFRGYIDYKCFELQRFWTFAYNSRTPGTPAPSEFYIARYETWLDQHGRSRVRLLGFGEDAEPDVDEYGVQRHHPEEDYIPEVDPFEERKRSEHNRKLVQKHLHLILDEDV